MKSQSIIDTCNFFKMYWIRYFQAFHSIRMSPFWKMPFKSSSSPITIISTNLAFILNTKTMELIKPIRNWFSIPTKRKIFWIVVRLLGIGFTENFLDFLRSIVVFCFHFFISSWLFFSYLIHCIMYNITKTFFHKNTITFKKSQYSLIFFSIIYFFDFFFFIIFINYIILTWWDFYLIFFCSFFIFFMFFSCKMMYISMLILKQFCTSRTI